MSAVDRKHAYKVLKPMLHGFLRKKLEAERSALEMAQQMGYSDHAIRTQRDAPGRIALLEDLATEIDGELGA